MFFKSKRNFNHAFFSLGSIANFFIQNIKLFVFLSFSLILSGYLLLIHDYGFSYFIDGHILYQPKLAFKYIWMYIKWIYTSEPGTFNILLCTKIAFYLFAPYLILSIIKYGFYYCIFTLHIFLRQRSQVTSIFLLKILPSKFFNQTSSGVNTNQSASKASFFEKLQSIFSKTSTNERNVNNTNQRINLNNIKFYPQNNDIEDVESEENFRK